MPPALRYKLGFRVASSLRSKCPLISTEGIAIVLISDFSDRSYHGTLLQYLIGYHRLPFMVGHADYGRPPASYPIRHNVLGRVSRHADRPLLRRHRMSARCRTGSACGPPTAG